MSARAAWRSWWIWAGRPRLRDLTLTFVTAALLGVVCAHTGRMGSPYYAGLALMFAARVAFLPTSFWQTLGVCGLIMVTWLAFTCLWPSSLPRPGWDGWRGTTTTIFGVSVPLMLLYIEYRTERLALGLEAAELRGRYRLLRHIGAGGMGEVFLAVHASLRRHCAVKIMKEHLNDPRAVARFEREVAAASSLRHPSTISIYDFGISEEGRPYYVMEYLEGCDLSVLLKEEGPLAPARAVHLLLQAARSLSEAHALGMVHRDVKPANLFVTRTVGAGELLKVLDFGLVKWAESGAGLTQPHTLMGTPAFMAPEALAGQEVDARADVYALGAVAYLMLSGQRPFASPDPRAEIYRQLHDPPPPLPGPASEAASPALVEIIARCLANDPAHRYRDAGELAEALARTPESATQAG